MNKQEKKPKAPAIKKWEKVEHFPRRISLGKNSIAWKSTEVQEWLSQHAKTQEVIT